MGFMEDVKNFAMLCFGHTLYTYGKWETGQSSTVSVCVSQSHMVTLDLSSATDKVRAEWDSICV